MAGSLVDLNADAGESFGAWQMGNDAQLFPWLTSVNLATGFHAGDPFTMHRTASLAVRHGLAIGAHPSYPDRVGFGRRALAASQEEIYADTLYQLGALAGILRPLSQRVHHLKAHGALYNRSATDPSAALALLEAAHDFDPQLPVMVPPRSVIAALALELGVPIIREGFPDRGYLKDGTLAPRQAHGALINDPRLIAERALRMVQRSEITSLDGEIIAIECDSICLHGDGPVAAIAAQEIRNLLAEQNINFATHDPAPVTDHPICPD